MLTKDLLEYRIVKGRVRPRFIDARAPELLALAEALVALASEGVGTESGALEEALELVANGAPQPKVAAGLVKLLLDRMDFEEPEPDAPARRREAFQTAASVLRALPDDALQDTWEPALAARFDDVAALRARLYADHPDNRKLVAFKAITPASLLDRYNLALVQGLLLRANRVTVTARDPDLLRVRRLLRSLKWHRLVADVRREGDDWTIDVEGPAAILQMQKKYGLQLALFAGAVPVLKRWTLGATLAFERGREATLELDESAPLVAFEAQALGFVPEEIDVVVQKLGDGPWDVDTTPVPRPTGVSGLCVPDLTIRTKDGARALHLEFFHRWHRHALARRLAELRTRPDPELVLAVDEAIASEDLPLDTLAADPRVFLFKGFPSERKLRALFADRLS